MSPRCSWCGVFVAADTKSIRFVNILGEPVEYSALCPSCRPVCCDLAARNVANRPNQPFLSSLRSRGRVSKP